MDLKKFFASYTSFIIILHSLRFSYNISSYHKTLIRKLIHARLFTQVAKRVVIYYIA